MWTRQVRVRVITGAMVVALGVASIGFAAGQSATMAHAQQPTPGQSTGGPGRQAFVDAVARQLGITSERLQQAFTQARAELGLPGPGGPGGPGGRRGPGRRGHGAGERLTAAAQAIGITVEQLRQELPGKSLAQVAQAHGKNPSDVATALKNAANQRIDEHINTVVPSFDDRPRQRPER